MSEPQRSLPRWFVPAWVAFCCVATLVAKLLVNEPRVAVNHGDISFYYVVAQNLAEGRGFVIDYIWNFWNHPAGIPNPSNVWWMPLTSAICALGMKLFGMTYTVAQNTMIVVTSVLPWVMFLLGRELFRSRTVALLGATVAATFHLFMDQPSAPLSHGPFVVLCSLSLWLIVRSLRDPASLKWAGAAIAATQLARSDGIVLFGALVVAHLVNFKRVPWKSVVAVPVFYAVVMLPWWGHNLSVHGALMPGGSFRAVYLQNYEQWYSLPENVTPERWLENGWDPVIAQKTSMSKRNLTTATTGLVAGAADRKGAWDHPAVVIVLWLSWCGLLFTLKRRFAAFWTLFALEWIFYSLVFTAVGHESFRSGMYAVYPTLVLCAIAGLLALVKLVTAPLPTLWRSEKRRTIIASVFVAWIVLGQFTFAKSSMVRKVRGIEALNGFYSFFKSSVVDRLDLADEIIMARDVHELNAITGLRCVMIPFDDQPTILATAKRYGARYLLLLGDPIRSNMRPSLMNIDRSPRFQRVAGPAMVHGIRFQFYRILD
jgi:hypothetical protein